jgi:hypothetical protein
VLRWFGTSTDVDQVKRAQEACAMKPPYWNC